MASKGEKENVHSVFVGTPAWKVPLGSIRRSCKKDTNTVVKELDRESVV